MTRREAIEYLIENEVVNCRNANRNRAILYSRFINGLTFERIAELHDMSPIQVSRIVHKYGDPLLIKLSEMIEK